LSEFVASIKLLDSAPTSAIWGSTIPQNIKTVVWI